MAAAPTVAPALVGAWADGDDGAVAALARTWRHAFGARSVHGFAEVDGDETMLLAEFDHEQQAVDAGGAGSDPAVRVHSFVHGRSNLAGTDGGFDGTPYLFVVRVFAPSKWDGPLRQWLHGEHFDRQVATPGLLWARGYESLRGPFHFLNIWGVERPDVPDSEEYLEIRNTPWYAEVRPAFAASDVRRSVYRPVSVLEDPV